jgi:signal transduction histidine kinase
MHKTSGSDLLFILITVIAACFWWSSAIVVYRNNKKNPLNRTLAITGLFTGLWTISGIAGKIVSRPSDTITLWTYRWAYASGIMASAFFFLFFLGLYLGRAPKKKVYYPVIMAASFFAVLSFSPLIIKSASYRNGTLTSKNGILWPLASFVVLAPLICGVYLVYKKWKDSSGIDRARASVFLCGIALFLPIVILCVFVIPIIVGNDFSTNFSYLASIIPAGLTSYAIVRLRLLDVRIILRKTSIFIIGTILLSVPMIVLFLVFNSTHLNLWVERALTLLVFMVLIFFAPDVWKYIQNLSSKLFFSELYDEFRLLESVSSKLVSQTNLQTGLISALSEIVAPLGLSRIEVVIPPSVINEKSWHFECSLEDKGNGGLLTKSNDNYGFAAWLHDVKNTIVTEEAQRWPKDSNEKILGNRLAAAGIFACVPIKISSEIVGYFLVSGKVTHKAFSTTDISFLEKAAQRFGLFIDNYALSAQLGAQLKELKKVYLELHEAYQFKSEIIDVTSHEFRTPVTLVNGFAQTLLDRWDQLGDPQKLSLLTDVIDACSRITTLTEQFLRVSKLKEGKISIEKRPIRFSEIIQPICSSLLPEEQERLIIEAEPDLLIVSDPEHIQLVLKNILENAFRFSPVDKPVVIKAWRNSINDFIQIHDSGNGIPSEEIEKIFEPFVRLESINHHSRGMGLGLYIVRLLSSKLGIEVEIDSAEGVGTTVTLTIGLSYGFASSTLRSSLSESFRKAK